MPAVAIVAPGVGPWRRLYSQSVNVPNALVPARWPVVVPPVVPGMEQGAQLPHANVAGSFVVVSGAAAVDVVIAETGGNILNGFTNIVPANSQREFPMPGGAVRMESLSNFAFFVMGNPPIQGDL